MSSPPVRLRRACEPCRRKKARCPGEKPACSTCSRLHQRCTYARIEDSTRVHKSAQADRSEESASLQENVRRLETRMDSMMDTIHEFLKRSQQTSPSRALSAHDSPATMIRDDTLAVFATPSSSHDRDNRFDPHRCPEPPHVLLQSLVQIYIDKIDNQPLRIFDKSRLLLQVTGFSPLLLHSFLALTIRYSDDSFYTGLRTQAIEYYKSSVHAKISHQTSNPTVSFDVLASLCLLTLNEIEDGLLGRAFMAISIAARIVNCTNLLSHQLSSDTTDDLSRCAWSVFVLDKIYGSSFRTLPAFPNESNISEAALLDGVRSDSSIYPVETVAMTGLTGSSEPEDRGINAYCVRFAGIWGHLMSYLRRIKMGHLEKPWTPDSVYQRIASQMFDLEVDYPEIHRLKLARFDEKSNSTLINQRDYWVPWVFTQLMYHSVRGVLNHPFIHLARLNGRPKLRAPSFMQHVIDQAVTHASWVVKLLRMCSEKGLEIHDPFLGHLTSVSATILLFLRFSKDSEISSKAKDDFEFCQTFLSGMAMQHTHLQHTSSKLALLGESFTQYNNAAKEAQPPKAESSLLWDLLDYAASSSPFNTPRDSAGGVELNIDTQFLSPLTTHTPTASTNVLPQIESVQHDVLLNFWDDAAFEFDALEFPDLGEFVNPILTKGLW